MLVFQAMKILILYRHFWPDSPPYASMLRSIGRSLTDAGHDVTVWAEQPCYKASDYHRNAPSRETLDGIKVERLARLPVRAMPVAMRLLDKLLFIPRLLVKAVCSRVRNAHYDLVWTATIPPVLQGWAGRKIAGLFGARFLYHCQDLYPELAGHMGLWRQDGLLYRTMADIERRTRERADMLVTLSTDMEATVRALGEPQNLKVINNFPLESFSDVGTTYTNISLPLTRNDRKIQLIFAGNIGLFQGLETVIDAMRLIESDCPDIEFVLMGEGKALPNLKRRASGLSNVRFERHRAFDEARSLIATADVGVVSLEPEIYRYAFPSKTLTYLDLDVPLLVLVEEDSELASMVLTKKIGFVVEPRDTKKIEDQLRTISGNRSQLWDMKRAVHETYCNTLSGKARLKQWTTLFDDLAASGGPKA